MRDTRIMCPICKNRYRKRIGDHLHKTHNIPYTDSEQIKNGIFHFFYFQDDEENENKVLELLKKHGYNFEKLRRY